MSMKKSDFASQGFDASDHSPAVGSNRDFTQNPSVSLKRLRSANQINFMLAES
jgi:hypothetical protein